MGKPAAVLVQFDNHETAEAFVAKINGTLEYIEDSPRGFRVVGLWRLPTVFCECDNSSRMKMKAYARGQKFGWWVHTACGRPSRVWTHIAPRLWTALGRNILPGVPDDGEPRMYPGHARDHDNAAIPSELGIWYDPDSPKRDRQQARREARRAARPRRT